MNVEDGIQNLKECLKDGENEEKDKNLNPVVDLRQEDRNDKLNTFENLKIN